MNGIIELDSEQGRQFGFASGLFARGSYLWRDDQTITVSMIIANQPGRGAHVANAGYMVAEAARGLGIGFALGEHSLETARGLGYRSMQFNFVTSCNPSAVRLWQRLGFEIVGTLPAAFRLDGGELADAYVMSRAL